MPTHFHGTRKQVRALDLFIKLTRATESISSRLERSLSQQGLTLSQLGVLEVLLHLGPMCQRELAKKLLRSHGNVTTVLDNLEKAGHIERVRNDDDRRFITVHLTDAGRAFIARVFPCHAQDITELMSVLEPAEMEDLGRLCRKLGTAVSRSG